MRDFFNLKTWLMLGAGLTFTAFAIAQEGPVSSPFAKKAKKKQAWEVATPQQPTAPSQSYTAQTHTGSTSTGSYIPPNQSQYSGATTYQAPGSGTSYRSHTVPETNYSPPVGTYVPSGRAPNISDFESQPLAGQYSYPSPQSSYQPGYEAHAYNQPGQTRPSYQHVQGQSQQPPYPSQAQSPYANHQPQPYPGQGVYNPQQNRTQTATYRPSWQDRLGLSNIATDFGGYLRLGAAATQRDDWSEDFIADGLLRGEVSGITQGGLEYGLGGRVRGQYDKFRRGFGGRVGDCPPEIAGCASVDIAGTPTAIRGHTTQFYTAGPSNAQEEEFALEGAYLFLRSAYGDVTVGRDDGAAYLFSLGAPSLLAIGASNSPVDYTGLDSVKTVNDASGFAEKITYTSPRLLGDTVGVGVQFGVSYAPDSRACGVDYCVRANGADGSGVLSPDIEDVFEAGLALDRTFDNGFSVEATATYATGSEDTGLDVFDDLQALGLGLELGYGDFILGGSYLNSNNGLTDGDYIAWDAGLTWQPSQLGFTLGYGQSEDRNINLESEQAVFGVSYDWNDNLRFGTGAQYIRRDVPINRAGVVTQEEEDALSIFLEGRVTF